MIPLFCSNLNSTQIYSNVCLSVEKLVSHLIDSKPIQNCYRIDSNCIQMQSILSQLKANNKRITKSLGSGLSSSFWRGRRRERDYYDWSDVSLLESLLFYAKIFASYCSFHSLLTTLWLNIESTAYHLFINTLCIIFINQLTDSYLS